MPSFPAIIEACIAEAERLERRSSPFPFVNELNARRIAELHHIAVDAQAALDGCSASDESVEEWFGDEHSLWSDALALDDVAQITGDALRPALPPLRGSKPAAFRAEHGITIAEEDAARPAHFTLGAVV